MFDLYHRKISYLRISVTDRCNLRCHYCMPSTGIKMMDHKEILSFEEITEVVKTMVPLGINKIRFTGGEPLIRKGIENLVGMISGIQGIREIGLTTNGILLEEFAGKLAANGLNRVNISLDTINPENYRRITKGGDIGMVFKGIEEARRARLEPIKINCVKTTDTSVNEIKDLELFCKENNLQIRYIRQMDLATGTFFPVQGADGGHCEKCNRIRLAANGNLKPCLFSEYEYNIRELGITRAIEMTLANKPACGEVNFKNEFYNIGG